jgi:outer membrane lipoprotein-sorting protein
MKVTVKHIDSDVPKENYEFFNDFIQYLQKSYPLKHNVIIKFVGERVGDMTTGQRNTKKPDDFIWFTTKPGTKRMFVMDGETKERYYADSSKKFVWWNEMDYHGTEAVSHFSFSIRIDGKFKPEITEALSK